MGIHGFRRGLAALIAAMAIASLSACGGGSDSGDFVNGGGGGGGAGGGGGGTTTPTAAAVSISLPDGALLPADADTVAEGLQIVAVAVDGNNVAVEGVPVTFSATSGELTINDLVTNSTGRATAVLTTASNPNLRDITVLVSAGGVQATVTVTVIAPNVSNPPAPRLGLIDPATGTFTAGQLGISTSPLSAGGTSALRLDIVDSANGNVVFTDPVTVTFSSRCLADGTATITNNPATSVNGAVNTTYEASGCSGNDTITANATVEGVTITAQGTINVLAAALGSIEFVSATPTNIGLRGGPGQVTSTVVFRVRNTAGNPVQSIPVTFALNTTVGGIALDPDNGITDNQGLVQTVVRAGTVSTVVRVTATATQNGVDAQSQSEQLTITTGIPDQNSYSLSVDCPNVEGLVLDGEQAQVNLLGADRFNNPVPDGTAVNFTTEGGSIVGNCTTVGGACSVNWTSQNPRPASFNGCGAAADPNNPDGVINGFDSRCAVGAAGGASRAGRSRVLAVSVGEESFSDLDGDGLFDVGATPSEFPAANDLSEAFLDFDEDGVRDDGSDPLGPLEPFVDFDSDFGFDLPDGQFNGLLCDSGLAPPDNVEPCADPRTLNVRGDLTIVMSGSSPVIDFSEVGDDIANNDGGDVIVSGALYNGSGSVVAGQDGLFTVSAIFRDINDQPLPATTTIVFGGGGDAGNVDGTSSFAVPCTANDSGAANLYGVAFATAEIDPGDPDQSGRLEITVTAPSTLVSISGLNVRATRAPVTLSSNVLTIAETGTESATITAQLPFAVSEDVTVELDFSGSATAGTDFSTSATSIVIAAGDTSGTATVTAIDGDGADPGESVTVGISSVRGEPGGRIGTLLSDDTAVVGIIDSGV